jgi:hypothetical protein
MAVCSSSLNPAREVAEDGIRVKAVRPGMKGGPIPRILSR